ncbi:MAG: hypothetical protein JWN94_1459 [Betaproteobacteria bacterium]|nr:hypothetical protein [Betaproteobacteria bacterium]
MGHLSGFAGRLPRALPIKRALAIAAAFIVVYVSLDWATYLYAIRPFAITTWNPCAGFALAFLLVCGIRFWPALAIAAFAADVLVRGVPPPAWLEPLGVCIITAGYVAMAAVLHDRFGFRNEFDHLHDMSTLIVVSAVGSLLLASAYVGVYHLQAFAQPYDFERAVIQFWIGDLLGIVTTTPLLLLISNWPTVIRQLGTRPWPRIALHVAAIVCTLWLIFGLKWVDEYKLFYLLFIPLIWFVMKHAIAGAALGITVIQLGLITSVRLSGYKTAAVLEFQFLMLALAATGLFLGMFVTERRAARQALNNSESRLRAIVSTAPDSIVTVDSGGIVIAANPAAVRVFGFGAGGLIGAHVHDVLPEYERAARTREVTEVIGVRRDGSRFTVELAVGSTGGDPPAISIAIARDISRRKEIERQLSEKQAELNRSARLAAAGEMAAALAHELHQPLSAIRNYTRAAQLLAPTPANSELMVKVEREAARAAEVVQRLRDFFRGGTSRLECIGITELIDGALEQLREEAARHQIALETTIAGHDELLVDRIQVNTVIHSLVGNAIEAIAAVNAGDRRIEVTAQAARDGWVVCSIADTGPGISPAIVDRLFEPFATTKPTGIGLGLAMSRSMIESHGGQLWIERQAAGTVFKFSLPCADAKEARHAAA